MGGSRKGPGGQGMPRPAGAPRRDRDHRRHLEQTGELESRRRRRIEDELRAIVVAQLTERARAAADADRFDEVVDAVLERRVDPWTAAAELAGL